MVDGNQRRTRRRGGGSKVRQRWLGKRSRGSAGHPQGGRPPGYLARPPLWRLRRGRGGGNSGADRPDRRAARTAGEAAATQSARSVGGAAGGRGSHHPVGQIGQIEAEARPGQRGRGARELRDEPMAVVERRGGEDVAGRSAEEARPWRLLEARRRQVRGGGEAVAVAGGSRGERRREAGSAAARGVSSGRREQGEGECGGARGKQRERCKGDEGSQVCVRVCGQGMDKVRVCGGSRDPTVKRKDKVWLERKKARRMD